MRYLREKDIHYSKHPLRRVLTVTDFISADYIEGQFQPSDPHSHQDAWELAYCAAGRLGVFCRGAVRRLGSGQFFLIPPGTVHDYSTGDCSCRFFVLCFTLAGGDTLLPFRNEVFCADSFQKGLFSRMIMEVCSAYERDPRLEERVKILDFRPSEKSPFGGEQVVASSLEMILLYTLRILTMQGDEVVRAEGFQKAARDYLMQSVLSYIEDNARISLSVSDIAVRFNYSRAYLSSLFREATGLTVKDTVTKTVLKKAQEELRRREKPVSEIAAAFHFDSPQYFSHWFKRLTGVSPCEYRKKEGV